MSYMPGGSEQEGGGFFDSLSGIAGGIAGGIGDAARSIGGGIGGGMGPFFNPTPDIGPIFDGGFGIPDFDFGGGGGGGGPFFNPTPELPTGLLDLDFGLPTGLLDPGGGYDNPWIM